MFAPKFHRVPSLSFILPCFAKLPCTSSLCKYLPCHPRRLAQANQSDNIYFFVSSASFAAALCSVLPLLCGSRSVRWLRSRLPAAPKMSSVSRAPYMYCNKYLLNVPSGTASDYEKLNFIQRFKGRFEMDSIQSGCRSKRERQQVIENYERSS